MTMTKTMMTTTLTTMELTTTKLMTMMLTTMLLTTTLRTTKHTTTKLTKMLTMMKVKTRAGGTRSGRGRECAKLTLLTGRGRGRVDAFENADADAVDSYASSRVLAVMLFL